MPVRDRIIMDGQPYVDEPVYLTPKHTARSAVGEAVRSAFGIRESVLTPKVLIDHQRVKLRWMKPDGKGGLVPR